MDIALVTGTKGKVSIARGDSPSRRRWRAMRREGWPTGLAAVVGVRLEVRFAASKQALQAAGGTLVRGGRRRPMQFAGPEWTSKNC